MGETDRAGRRKTGNRVLRTAHRSGIAAERTDFADCGTFRIVPVRRQREKLGIHRPDSFRDSFKPGTLVPMEKLKCLSIDSGDFIQEELAAFGAELVKLPNSLQKLSRVVFAVPYSSLTGKLQPLSICILESDEMVCHDISMLHIDVVEVDHGAGGFVDCVAARFVDCDHCSHGGRNVTARNRTHDLTWSNFDNFFETAGTYLNFVNMTTDGVPSGQDRLKIKKGYKVAIYVQVMFDNLRKKLETDGIIKGLSTGF